jgi:hypothetical protein
MKAFGQSAFGKLQMCLVAEDGTPVDWTPLGTLVRAPQITAIHCTAVDVPTCTVDGSNLFLVEAFDGTKDFVKPTEVPTGFGEKKFAVPTPADGTTLYLKLRDDPSAVAAITLSTPIQQPTTAPVQLLKRRHRCPIPRKLPRSLPLHHQASPFQRHHRLHQSSPRLCRYKREATEQPISFGAMERAVITPSLFVQKTILRCRILSRSRILFMGHIRIARYRYSKVACQARYRVLSTPIHFNGRVASEIDKLHRSLNIPNSRGILYTKVEKISPGKLLHSRRSQISFG